VTVLINVDRVSRVQAGSQAKDAWSDLKRMLGSDAQSAAGDGKLQEFIRLHFDSSLHSSRLELIAAEGPDGVSRPESLDGNRTLWR